MQSLILNAVLFGLIASSFLFPSLLDGYSFLEVFSNRVPVLGFIFVLDELIVLFGIFLCILYLLIRRRISSIVTEALPVSIFILYITLIFLASYGFDVGSGEFILKNRWILINSLIFFIPFVVQLTEQDVVSISERFVKIVLFLSVIKIIFYWFFYGQNSPLSVVSPDFSFYSSIACFLLILNCSKFMYKAFGFLMAMLVAILSSQMSSIVFFLVCVLLAIYGKEYVRVARIIKYSTLTIFLILVFSYVIDIEEIVQILGLNIQNFNNVFYKIETYFIIWSAAIHSLFGGNFLTGLGPGEVIEFFYENSDGDLIFHFHSLAHNAFVTVLFLFGVLGLLMYWYILFVPFFKSARFKRSFHILNNLKLLLVAVVINFMTTPGIWKVRKGVVFWLLLGLLYYFVGLYNRMDRKKVESTTRKIDT